LIVEVIGIIVLNIVFVASGAAAVYTLGVGVGLGTLFVVGFIRVAFGICMLILSILGIINAVNGNDKPLPVIGSIRVLK
jgi:hypothetical protein